MTAYLLEKGLHQDKNYYERLSIIKLLIINSYPYGRRLALRSGQDITESQMELTIDEKLKLQHALRFADEDDAMSLIA